jgi:hypothetical protein
MARVCEPVHFSVAGRPLVTLMSWGISEEFWTRKSERWEGERRTLEAELDRLNHPSECQTVRAANARQELRQKAKETSGCDCEPVSPSMASVQNRMLIWSRPAFE